MKSNAEEVCKLMLQLLDATRQETRSALSVIDPERVACKDNLTWHVRDVVGHLGVWMGEAAHSLSAHTGGSEYHCIPEAKYDEYNALAVEKRRTWNIEQVWAEYETCSDQFKLLVERMPVEKWEIEMLYPWNEKGTVRNLIEVMMNHEIKHREIILAG
jgi:hypothetical protein